MSHFVVTGGAGFIGSAIVRRLLAEGAPRVVVIDNLLTGREANLEEVRGKVDFQRADIRNYQEIAPIIRGAAVVFHEAAIPSVPRSIDDPIPSHEVNADGTFNVLRAAHAFLRKPGAVVVNISAPQAMHPRALQSHVCAAKAGVDMLTRVLAIEWGGDGIRVNSVMPGPIDETEGMARLAPSAEARAAVVRGIPLGRMGSKRDVADMVLFLASPQAAFVSGSVIPVDGGWSLGGTSVSSAGMKKMFQMSAPKS
jgi:NAD(P)-dependent dehydrogenase (short-subunit alcohol dehydrogenase family)